MWVKDDIEGRLATGGPFFLRGNARKVLTRNFGASVFFSYWNGLSSKHQSIITKRDDWSETDMQWHFVIDKRTGALAFGSVSNNIDYAVGTPMGVSHVAVVYDGTNADLYVNGISPARSASRA